MSKQAAGFGFRQGSGIKASNPIIMTFRCRAGLVVIALLFAVLSLTGITWGLPGRGIDRFLFGDGLPWSGEKIYRLAGAAEKFTTARGADVDVDFLPPANEPIPLTATDEDVARIYLRYRLYTHQPDEMIVMMALARMRPRSLDLDPRLYQYGGLFIYPVGALIGLGGLLGLIDVRPDVVHYLDHPDKFARFYLVSRGYAAAWGLLGVFLVFGIARRLAGDAAGLLAALLYTLMPVVICMAHEGKPHLPGAVLMLAAVYFALRMIEPRTSAPATSTPPEMKPPSPNENRMVTPTLASAWNSRDGRRLVLCCGAALGMVLSTLPVLVLIPLTAWWTRTSRNDDPEHVNSIRRAGVLSRSIFGLLLASLVYFLTNPYLLINALANPDVLRSNFGNSLAMYEIARVGEGFLRVLELTAEGATWPVVVVGSLGLVLLLIRNPRAAAPLAVLFLILVLQFVLIGAGKPGEYGRFGIFTNAALAIGSAAAVYTVPRSARWLAWILRVGLPVGVALAGWPYLANFRADATSDNSRILMAEEIAAVYARGLEENHRIAVHVPRQPAPYLLPPLDFSRIPVWLTPHPAQAREHPGCDQPYWLEPLDRPGQPVFTYTPRECFVPRKCRVGELSTSDDRRRIPYTPISWANKPFRAVPLPASDYPREQSPPADRR